MSDKPPRYSYHRDRLVPFSRWRHTKRASDYFVLGVSRDSTNGHAEGQLHVVYMSADEGKWYHRKLEEFLDGRFEPLGNSAMYSVLIPQL